ncbi:type II toxin-antitoxin system prevent-host-death family antitoxin [Polaromonas sp. P1(28)-8]|nr:type II toxin-antitoxin system prevent-host-death family antitoxin [Polaromonas sp. P1(28)-8]
MSTWQLQEAKGKFSEVVKRALSEGPQGITGARRARGRADFARNTRA